MNIDWIRSRSWAGSQRLSGRASLACVAVCLVTACTGRVQRWQLLNDGGGEPGDAVAGDDGGPGDPGTPGDTTLPSQVTLATLETGIALDLLFFPGNITAPAFSPDGTLLAFRADVTHDERDELLVVNADGSGLRRVGLRPTVDGSVRWHAFTPDSARIIYVMGDVLAVRNKLYSVPVAGGPTVELTASLVPELIMDPSPVVHMLPDSSRVIFNARVPTSTLFSAAVDGSDAFQVLPANVSLNFSTLSPNGTFVALVGQVNGGPVVPQRVNVDGSGWIEIDPIQSLNNILISSDSSTIAYSDAIGIRSIQVVDADGINGKRTISDANTRVWNGRDDIAFLSDSTRVIYIGHDGDFVMQVYSALTDGGGAAALNPVLVAGGDVRDFITTSDARVLYAADQDTANVVEFYAVPGAGGTSTKLSGTLVAGGIVASMRIAVAPDASRAVFLADADTDGVWELFSAPLDGTSRAKLSQAGTSLGTSPRFIITADSQRVLIDEGADIRSVTIDGNSSVVISDPSDGGVATFLGTNPTTSRVWYTDWPGVGLFTVDIDATTPVSVIPPFTAGSHAGSLRANATSTHVAYVGSWQLAPGQGAIKVVPVATQVPVQVSQSGLRTPLAETVRFTPPGDQLLYRTSSSRVNAVGLDGSNHITVTPSISVTSFQPTADGQTLVYSTFSELYARNIDGSGETLLNGALVSGGGVNSQRTPIVTPDSQRVIYAADQTTDGVTELYSSNIDGTGNVKLNGTLQPGASFRTSAVWFDWDLAPNGTRVVYIAQQNSALRQLYATNVDGSSNAVLTTVEVKDSALHRFRISPDSTRAVYVADTDTAGLFELYAARLDGTGSNKINGTLAAGEIIGFTYTLPSFLITADSLRVIYRVDSTSTGKRDLYSAAIDGSGAVRLNPAMAGRVVTQIANLAATDRILYLAEDKAAGTSELFSVRPDGTDHRGVVADLTPPASIADFAVSSDGAIVIYRADADTPGTLELYRVGADGLGRLKLHEDLTSGFGVQAYEMTPDGRSVIFLQAFDGPTLSVRIATDLR